MNDRTAVEFEEQATRHDIKEWDSHDCIMCGYMGKFVFLEGKVYYDPGCHCIGKGHGENLELRTWEEIADQYNMQDDEWKMKYDEFWKFSTEEL
jgi:hypothetical protein